MAFRTHGHKVPSLGNLRWMQKRFLPPTPLHTACSLPPSLFATCAFSVCMQVCHRSLILGHFSGRLLLLFLLCHSPMNRHQQDHDTHKLGFGYRSLVLRSPFPSWSHQHHQHQHSHLASPLMFSLSGSSWVTMAQSAFSPKFLFFYLHGKCQYHTWAWLIGELRDGCWKCADSGLSFPGPSAFARLIAFGAINMHDAHGGSSQQTESLV